MRDKHMSEYELRKVVLQERAIRDGRIWYRVIDTWEQTDPEAWLYTTREKEALEELWKRSPQTNQPRTWGEHRGPCPDSCICGGINSPSRWVTSWPAQGSFTEAEMRAVKEARKLCPNN